MGELDYENKLQLKKAKLIRKKILRRESVQVLPSSSLMKQLSALHVPIINGLTNRKSLRTEAED